MVTDDLNFLFLWQIVLSLSYLLLSIAEADHLRRHVSWCTTAVLDWHVLFLSWVIRVISFISLRLLQVTDTKVTNLKMAKVRQQDVLELDIAVGNPFLMYVTQTSD